MKLINLDDRPLREMRYIRPTYEALRAEGMILTNQAAFWRRNVHGEVGYSNESLTCAFDYEWFLRVTERFLSFHVNEGETLAIVGESGCGKSVTALSLMRLVADPPGRIVGGAIRLAGTDLARLDEAAMRAIRGNRIAMIFQEPMTSLNPVMTVGAQIAEALYYHRGLDWRAAKIEALRMLDLVRIPDSLRRELGNKIQSVVKIAIHRKNRKITFWKTIFLPFERLFSRYEKIYRRLVCPRFISGSFAGNCTLRSCPGFNHHPRARPTRSIFCFRA